MSKYNSERTTIGGETFDSRKEAERWVVLRAKEERGEISDLRRQVKYVLIPAQYKDGKCIFRSVTYIADFVYEQDGEKVVEDVKGFRTPEYIIKRKLMYQIFGIYVMET